MILPSEQGPAEAAALSERERLVQSVVDHYRERLNEGAIHDRHEVVRQHPDIADLLEPRLSVLDMLTGGGQPPGSASPLSGTTVQVRMDLQTSAPTDGAPAPAPDDRTVLERLGFAVVRRLGEGSFGRVYLARQPRTERPVAVKLTCNRGREARNLGQLDHDHIVKVHLEVEVAQSDLLVLCMEYVPGPTLEGLLARWADLPVGGRNGQGVLDVIDRKDGAPTGLDAAGWHDRQRLAGCDFVEAVCWMGARLAGALDHAHQRQVLHRDIKPANILLHPNGRPMLVDFNLAGDAGAAGGDLLGGTPLYMAPEHLDAMHDGDRCVRGAVDSRSDVYSLGVVLFELLAGRRPFVPTDEGLRELKNLPREEVYRRMADERRQAAPSARQWRPEVPVVLDRVIQRCLAGDPAERYQSAGDLAGVLDGCRELHQLDRSLPPAGWLTRLALSHPQAVGLLLPLLPHLVGAVVCLVYAASWVQTHPHGAELGTKVGLLAMWYSSVVFPLTGGASYYLARPIWGTLARLRRSEPLPADVVTATRRRALRKPGWGVLLSGLGWLPGTVVLPLALFVQVPEMAGWDALLHYMLSFLIAGLIALTYTDFIDQFLLLRVAYPLLWADPRQPRQTARAELQGVERRLRGVQVLSTLVPLATAAALLVGVYHSLGEGGPSAANKLFLVVIITLMGIGIAGSWLAVLISGYLGRVLTALKG